MARGNSTEAEAAATQEKGEQGGKLPQVRQYSLRNGMVSSASSYINECKFNLLDKLGLLLFLHK